MLRDWAIIFGGQPLAMRPTAKAWCESWSYFLTYSINSILTKKSTHTIFLRISCKVNWYLPPCLINLVSNSQNIIKRKSCDVREPDMLERHRILFIMQVFRILKLQSFEQKSNKK